MSWGDFVYDFFGENHRQNPPNLIFINLVSQQQCLFKILRPPWTCDWYEFEFLKSLINIFEFS